MTIEARLDIIGAALADVSRSRILCELMDGRAFTNKELACAAEVTAQTASAHLKHLQSAGLTTSLRSGRHIYHRIADSNVAGVLEAIAGLSPTDHLHRNRTVRKGGTDILRARSCYNHVAGRLGVLLTERMIALKVLQIVDGTVSIGEDAGRFLGKFGLTVPHASGPGKPSVQLCLDWTERQHHISGPLATALMQKMLDAKWLARHRGNRALIITPLGYEVFTGEFGMSRKAIEGAQ